MSVARALRRSLSGKKPKKSVTCHVCGNATYLTLKGVYHRHRRPPKAQGLDFPLRAGPPCPAAGATPDECLGSWDWNGDYFRCACGARSTTGKCLKGR